MPAPPYSTDMNASLLLIDEMARQGYDFLLGRTRDDVPEPWGAIFFSNDFGSFGADASTPMLAICRAALSAKGIEEKQN